MEIIENSRVVFSSLLRQIVKASCAYTYKKSGNLDIKNSLPKKMPRIEKEIAQLRQEIVENEEAIDELLLMKSMINRQQKWPSPR